MNPFSPDTSAIDNYYDRARYVLAWRVSLAFSAVFMLLIALYGALNLNEFIALLMGLAVSGGSLVYLNFSYNYKPLFWIYAVSGTVIIHFALNFIMDFTHYVDFIWITAIVLLTFIGLGKNFGMLFILVNTGGIGYFYFFTLNQHIETLQPKSNLMLTGDFIEVLLAMLIIAYLLHQYIKFTAHAQGELARMNSELEIQNEIVNRKNDENIALIKEVHHRVKNNLQIITSLLRLQKSELEPEMEYKFDEAINRIMTMSLIHQTLYQEKELSMINLKNYLTKLSTEVKAIFMPQKEVQFSITTDIESVELKTLVPLGLLINEMLTNSFKYAFSDHKAGVINIAITQEEDKFRLNYHDNGVWITPSEKNKNFGLELIQTLVEQMDGSFERVDSQYSFLLKNLNRQDK